MAKTGSKGRDDGTGAQPAPGRERKVSRSAMPLIFDDDDLSEELGADRKFNWSLARGLEILRAFSGGNASLGNGELAEITKLPKPTISRLTYTLKQLGYLQLNARSGKFEPTPAILALGYPVMSTMKIRVIARDYLQQLANEVGLTVAIGGRDRLGMIYVDASHPSTMMTLRLDVGSRVDIATSAMGRSFMHGISAPERELLLGVIEQRAGEGWPKLRDAIQRSFDEIDRRGFCIVDGEFQEDIRGVGVPLVAPDGGTVLALNAAGPRFAATLETLETVVGPRLVHLSRSVAPMLNR